MRDLILSSALFLRGAIAWLLVFAALLFALSILGIGAATTDASPTSLYVQAGTYLAISWAALGYCLLGSKEWLRWVSLSVPFFPAVLLLLYLAQPFL